MGINGSINKLGTPSNSRHAIMIMATGALSFFFAGGTGGNVTGGNATGGAFSYPGIGGGATPAGTAYCGTANAASCGFLHRARMHLRLKRIIHLNATAQTIVQKLPLIARTANIFLPTYCVLNILGTS